MLLGHRAFRIESPCVALAADLGIPECELTIATRDCPLLDIALRGAGVQANVPRS